jgi:hypothetical protein
MRVRAWSILLALLPALAVGGCAISGLLPDWSSADVAGPEPADYRFAIAARLKEIVGKSNLSDTLELSAPRRVDTLKGATWVICIKAQAFPLLPRYYAVLMQRGQIVDSRLSVVIDQCELQSYTAFNWNADLTNPR